VLGLDQTHFTLSFYARVKRSSEKGPKHVYAQEYRLYYYIIITLEGIDETNLKRTKINRS